VIIDDDDGDENQPPKTFVVSKKENKSEANKLRNSKIENISTLTTNQGREITKTTPMKHPMLMTKN